MSEFNKFANLKKVKNEVDLLLNNLKIKLDKLKEIYIDFIQNNKSNVFIFGLDSFYFQNKLLDDEYSNVIHFYKRILNRMYCEYYKLYKLIVNYIKDNISDTKINDIVNQNKNNIIVYKDLEPDKEYEFKQFELINNELISILALLHTKLSEKEKILQEHEEKQNIGLNINNFVSSFSYEVSTFKNQIILFENYLSFFYKLHFKYLQRFITKIQVFYTQINHDIVFDNGLNDNKGNMSYDDDANMFEFNDDSDVDEELTGEIIHTLQRSISKCNIGTKKNIVSSIEKKGRRKTMDSNVKININELEIEDGDLNEIVEKISSEFIEEVSLKIDDEINEKIIIKKNSVSIQEPDIIEEEKEEQLLIEESEMVESGDEFNSSEEEPIVSQEDPIVSEEKSVSLEEEHVVSEEKFVSLEEDPIVSEEKSVSLEEENIIDHDNKSIVSEYSVVTDASNITSETGENYDSKFKLTKNQKKKLRKKLREKEKEN